MVVAVTLNTHSFEVAPTTFLAFCSGVEPVPPNSADPLSQKRSTLLVPVVENRPARTTTLPGSWLCSVAHGVEPEKLKPHFPSEYRTTLHQRPVTGSAPASSDTVDSLSCPSDTRTHAPGVSLSILWFAHSSSAVF